MMYKGKDIHPCIRCVHNMCLAMVPLLETSVNSCTVHMHQWLWLCTAVQAVTDGDRQCQSFSAAVSFTNINNLQFTGDFCPPGWCWRLLWATVSILVTMNPHQSLMFQESSLMSWDTIRSQGRWSGEFWWWTSLASRFFPLPSKCINYLLKE